MPDSTNENQNTPGGSQNRGDNQSGNDQNGNNPRGKNQGSRNQNDDTMDLKGSQNTTGSRGTATITRNPNTITASGETSTGGDTTSRSSSRTPKDGAFASERQSDALGCAGASCDCGEATIERGGDLYCSESCASSVSAGVSGHQQKSGGEDMSGCGCGHAGCGASDIAGPAARASQRGSSERGGGEARR